MSSFLGRVPRAFQWLALPLFLIMVVGCGGGTIPVPATPSPVIVIPSPEQPLDPATAARWLTDGTYRLSGEPGHVRGVVAVLDERFHPHFVYQPSVEWMDERNEGGVIVTGMTPAGDRYERRLWTAGKGYDANGIGVRGERIVVTAGVPRSRATGLALLVWQSWDGGATWGEFEEIPFAGQAYQADVAWTPDGRVVLVAGVSVGDQAQTQIAVEAPGGGWQLHTPFPAGNDGAAHAVWMRDARDPQQAALPSLVVLASQADGFMVGHSEDGNAWDTTAVASVPAYTPRLMSAGAVLFATYHQYGQAGLWLARSTDGGRSWQVGSVFTGLLESSTHGLSVENAALLWDAQRARLFLVLARFDRATRHRRIVILSTIPELALSGDSAWTPDLAAAPWMPVTLPAAHTDQVRPYAVQRGAIAVIGWEGWYVPADPRTATEGDFRSASEPNYAVIRIPQLATAWQAAVDQGAR